MRVGRLLPRERDRHTRRRQREGQRRVGLGLWALHGPAQRRSGDPPLRQISGRSPRLSTYESASHNGTTSERGARRLAAAVVLRRLPSRGQRSSGQLSGRPARSWSSSGPPVDALATPSSPQESSGLRRPRPRSSRRRDAGVPAKRLQRPGSVQMPIVRGELVSGDVSDTSRGIAHSQGSPKSRP